MFAHPNKSEIKMSTVCPQCGTRFSEPVQFCDKCGANLEKEKVLQEQKQRQVTDSKFMSKSQNTANARLLGGIQIVSVIEIAIGLFGILTGIIMILLTPFVPDLIKSSPSQGVVYTNSILQFFAGLVLVVGVFTLVVSVLTIFIGYKLYRLESIGRLGSMIVASFALLAIPFGTVLGILALYLLTKPETMELFRERNKYL